MVSAPAQCYFSPTEKSNIQLADCHVHVGFMSNAEQVARDARGEGLLLFVNTVTPQEYLALREQEWTHLPNVRLGLGLHPWWVARGVKRNATPPVVNPDQPPIVATVGQRTSQTATQVLARAQLATSEDVALATKLACETPWIGEVGLDFSPRHTDPSSHEAQVSALCALLGACASPLASHTHARPVNENPAVEGGTKRGTSTKRVISIHSVASADVVLDLLEQTGAASNCTCVFHWFSGSTPALWRAIRMGCWFSVNEIQARTRRAKEQLKLVPGDRLLLETDLPSKQFEVSSAETLEVSLLRACRLLSAIRGTEPKRIQELTSRNAALLWDSIA